MNILRLKKKIDKQKVEFDMIVERFKKLKTLVFEYKDDKEKEIQSLKEQQLKFKDEIDSQKINFEKLVDKTTLEIESFIQKHKVDTKVQ